MQLVDLSHPVSPSTPVYPGTEPPRFEVGSSIDEHGFAEKRITLFSHTGTHMDAPAHMIPGGKTLDQFAVSEFTGRACVVDIESSSDDSEIPREVFESKASRLAELSFVVLRSGWERRWGQENYFHGFPVLTQGAARWLVDAGIRGIGVDMISVDPVDSHDFPVHHILLGAECLIIENLTRLSQLPTDRTFELFCLPLPIVDADGAPARVVAWLS